MYLILFADSYDKRAQKAIFKLERVKQNEVEQPLINAQYRFVNHVKEKYGYHVCGGGGSHYRELRLKCFSVSLTHPLSSEAMKKLLVELTEKLLEELNSHPEIRALGKYPEFNVGNIKLTIFNYGDSKPIVAVNNKGTTKIIERYRKGLDPGIYEKKTYSELFEEIYPEKQSNYSLTGEEITPEELFETPLKEIFLALEKKVDLAVKPYDFKFDHGNLESINSFQRNRNGIKEIYVCLMLLKENRKTPWTPLNLERARKTYLELLQVVLDTVNEDEGIRPHLANYPIRSDQIFFSFEMENMPFKKGDVNDMYKLQNDIVYRDKANSIAIKRESFISAQKKKKLGSKFNILILMNKHACLKDA